MNINNVNEFSSRISFSTENSFFDRDKLTIVNNIKNISNTNVSFNFISKMFHTFKRLSTLLIMSKTGRIGIKNRHDEKDKYSDSIKELNGRMEKCLIKENKVSENINNKVNELNSSLVNDKNKIEDKLQNMIEMKNKLVTEERKVDHFLSLIKNENVSFGTRYSFFNYLNELKRAESFCEQSNNSSDNKLSTTFKHIFEERVSRVKESDINKIYREVINTYTLNTTFLNNNRNVLTELYPTNENVLKNFPTNTEKEKFLSKINFLVSISESQLALKKDYKNKVDNLNRIMHRILNEEEQEAGINYSYRDTKEGWIKKYMNEFYGNKKIERQNIDTEGLSDDMVDTGIDADTISIHSSDYDGDISDNDSVLMPKRIYTNKEDSVISDDDSISIHSSDYDGDISDNDYEIANNKIYNNEEMLSDLVYLLESEEMSLLKNKNSNDLKIAIINILSKFSDLNNIVTESLKLSKDNNNNELMISLQKIKNFSEMILGDEQLNNIEENYSIELNNNNPFYSKVKGSLENITEKFTEIGDLIEGNKDNLNSIKKEIENSLQNVLTKVNYFTLAGKKELIDDVLILVDKFISSNKAGNEFENSENKMEWDGYIPSNNKLENINDDLEWDNDGLSVSNVEINNDVIKSTEKIIAKFILDNILLNNEEDITHSDLDIEGNIENKNTKEDLDKKIKFPSTLYQMVFNAENLDDKISDDKVSDDKINNEMDNEINNEVNKWLKEYEEK